MNRNRIASAAASRLTHLDGSALGMAARLAGVSSTEGATALTRMSLPFSSSPRAAVSAATAALLAA